MSVELCLYCNVMHAKSKDLHKKGQKHWICWLNFLLGVYRAVRLRSSLYIRRMQIYFTFRVDKESKEKNDMAQDLS